MIVTKTKIFWSEYSDSHHEIIKEFGIKETDARGDINIMPIEIYPSDGKLNTPISKWEYHEDFAGYNRSYPAWYNKEKAEKSVRSALIQWKKKKVITRKTKELSSGQYYIYKDVEVLSGNVNVILYDSSTVQRMCGSSTVQEMWDSSTVQKMWGSSTVQKMCGSSTVQEMWDSSTVQKMLGSSTVQEMWGSSTVQKMLGSSTVQEMLDSSTVQEMLDSSTVITYHQLKKVILKSKAIIVDRSKSKVKIIAKEKDHGKN
jgi:hypothetical protein